LSSAASRVRATILCVSSTRDRPRHTRSVHVAHTAGERFRPGWEKEAVPPQFGRMASFPKTTPESRLDTLQSHQEPVEIPVGQCPRTASCYPLRRRSRRLCLIFKTRGQSHLDIHNERLHQYLWPSCIKSLILRPLSSFPLQSSRIWSIASATDPCLTCSTVHVLAITSM
jgi:hypothetical protein